MGGPEVEAFLSHLAIERKVSVSTHKQALAAILFLYRHVLEVDLPWLQNIGRPRGSIRIPVVLSREEVARLLACVEPRFWVIAALLYGSGLRLSECLSLRIKDVDFDRGVIIVRDGKGKRDRVLMLPRAVRDALQAQTSRSRSLWMLDRAKQVAGVALPYALPRKLPRASESWAWYWLFRPPNCSVILERAIEAGSPVRADGRAGGHSCCNECRHRQAGDGAHVASLVCLPSARIRPRYSTRPGASRPQRREHYDDLHARDERFGDRNAQPSRVSTGARDSSGR